MLTISHICAIGTIFGKKCNTFYGPPIRKVRKFGKTAKKTAILS